MDRVTVRLEERQRELAESMADNGDAANQSEAVRDAIEHYAQASGYTNGEKKQTSLRWILSKLAAALIYIGLGTAAGAYFGPMEFRLAAVAPVMVGLGLFALEAVVAEYEPGVSRRIEGWFGRDRGAA